MTFYEFRQINTGGRYVYDSERGITKHVVIEAASAEEANHRAREIGLDFDDEDNCCGQRWVPAEDFDGSGGYDEPIVEDGCTPARELVPDAGDDELRGAHVFVHYADGRVQPHAVSLHHLA
ncbi:hypothetical protein V1227_18770 [Lentzea sp. DG1S-22]|uniref:DUF7296 family protein n=1 Tax=Lentzea sp. DG1S-22 TaxID=3108822 RepID=UPI002E75BA50|nr:hypothetical protein [Lentzea sp. DG1S-22]WVH84698.1 hypothetical protein V1227_18770 [Lentzea sp. DG1S-22]